MCFKFCWSRTNFDIICSVEYKKLQQQLRHLLMSAMNDVDKFCQRNSWLSDVWRYCSTWNRSHLEQLKGAPVSVIEVCPILFSNAVFTGCEFFGCS